MSRATRYRVLVWIAAATSGACSAQPDTTVIIIQGAPDGGTTAPVSFGGASGTGGSAGNPGNGGTGNAVGTNSGGTSAVAEGLPCDVATYFAAKCTSCHGNPPIPGALAALVTYADLGATSKEDPSKTEAQLSLARMKDAASPMPPGVPPSPSDVAIVEAWVNAGAPKGTCGTSPAGAGGSTSSSSGSTSSSSGSTSSSSGSTGSAQGVPCEIATYLAQKCTSCHGEPPIPGALASLVTYDELMATSKEDTSKNEVELSVARMTNAASPMPPGALPSSSEVALLQDWINAGYPKGSCGDGGAPPPPPPPPSVFDGAPLFTAKTGNSAHNAGRDCMECHATGGGEAPRFSFGGTLYDAAGNAVAGAEVRLVDANQKVISVYTGRNGTFYSGSTFSSPAHVGVRNASAALDMLTALSAPGGGACSSCHCTGTSCSVPRVHLP